MSTEIKKEIQFEIAHVLFMDIVGYSTHPINEQRALRDGLNQIVQSTERFREADAAGTLIKSPAGDGMALVFHGSPEEPVECALEISRALKEHPNLPLRMGVHSGPVSAVVDVNNQIAVAGPGINLAQRVMDCGDAGHILLSKRVADDLGEYEHWRPLLHDLGECEVKHGMRVSIVNLHADEVGNPQLPRKFQAQKKHRARMRLTAVTAALLALAAIVAGIAMFSRDRVRSTLSAPEKSIAVLPFENRSEDKANAYFADGIQDEILTRLAKIADLKVISRTSTEKYRNRPGNLKTVAEELGVVALLEGSVQKAGGKVRVVVQLIAAKSDHHLWAETYDRSLDDIFAVQSEIAGAVASALRANLTPQESVALKSAPTNNQTAYDLFLRAEYFFRIAHASFAIANLPEAVELYRQALAEDTRFALAYARLSFAESFLRWLGGAPKDGSPDQSRANAEKALALQPDLMEAHLALAYCDYYGRLDYAHALEDLSRAQALAPNNAEVLDALGNVYRRQLRFDEAIAAMERAAQYDPVNSNLFFNLAATYWWAGRNDKVQATYERSLALDPDNEGSIRFFARFLLEQRGDVEGARKLLRSRPNLQTELAETYWFTRDYESAIRLIENLPDSNAFLRDAKDGLLGVYLQRAGQQERARPLLEAARDRQIALLADKTISPRQVIFISIYLAQIELGLGHRDAAIHIAERGAQSDAVTHDPIQGASYRGALAGIYAEAGRNDQAIALISELLKSSQGFSGITPHTLRLDPTWDPLRNDPRFQKLVASPETK